MNWRPPAEAFAARQSLRGGVLLKGVEKVLPSSSEEKTVLDNKLRVVSQSVPYMDSVSIGIWVAAGARHEQSGEEGVSHFLEHMLFKGTERRTARQIADEMDMLGGHLNAYTEKEYTFFYAKVLREHLRPAFDILADMVLNSTLDPVEMEREKNVVLEEIKHRDDSPDELVHDLFEQTLWKNHPLGNSTIGEVSSVVAFTREKIGNFMRRRYTPDAIVIAAAGSVDHAELVECAVSAFGQCEGTQDADVFEPVQANFEERIVAKQTEQVHICIGTPGYRQNDENKYPLAIIDAIVGGGMSSRIFQEIRENRGLVYAIGSYSGSYKEGGMFTVYAGTSTENADQVLELIVRELENVHKHNVTDTELQRAKNQIRGALLMGQESTTNRMSRLANSEIYFGRIVPLEEVLGFVAKVDKDDIARVAEEILAPSRHALVVLGPPKTGRAVA